MTERISMPNFLLIAGSGRNVGKTTLACAIINEISIKHEVHAIKISHHMHQTDSSVKLLEQHTFYTLSEDIGTSQKDSSRFLKAGAKRSFYLQTAPDKLAEVVPLIRKMFSEHFVICESGGLHTFIQPAMFIVVKGDEIPQNKMHLLSYNPILVESNKGNPKFESQKVDSWLKNMGSWKIG
jgi:DNA polymerase III delta prime subunit